MSDKDELERQLSIVIFARFYDVPEKQRNTIVKNVMKLFNKHLDEVVKRVKPEDYGHSKDDGELKDYIPAILYDAGVDDYEQSLRKELGL